MPLIPTSAYKGETEREKQRQRDAYGDGNQLRELISSCVSKDSGGKAALSDPAVVSSSALVFRAMASCRAVVAFDVAASVSLRPLNLSLVEGQNGGLLAATLYRSALWLTRIDTNGTQGDNVRHSLLTRFERGEADALQVRSS